MSSYILDTYYQKNEWFEKNKDNFSSPPEYILEKYINLPNGVIIPKLDFIRFSKLKKDEVLGIYYVEIPPEFSFYHSSRSLGLNHVEFPITTDEKCDTTNPSNYSNFFGENPHDNIICTNVSYYGLPSDIFEYLLKSSYSDEVKDAYRQLPSDIKITGGKDIKANTVEYPEGIYAYKTDFKLKKLFILNFENLIGKENVKNYGKENVKKLVKLLVNNKENFKEKYNISDKIFNFIIYSCKISGGIGKIRDLISFFTIYDHFYKKMNNLSEKEIDDIYLGILPEKDYIYKKILEFARTIVYQSEELLGKTFFESNETFNTLYKTAKKLVEEENSENINKFLELPSFRFSTYELDRIFINSIYFLFDMLNIKFDGFISTCTYNFIKPYFHPEIILFQAPELSLRDMLNPYDISYRINPHNILQEFRKYRTTSIGTVHQGHLFEHSSWTAIKSLEVAEYFKIKEKSSYLSEFLIILSGFFHDIGKAGDCNFEYTEYFDLDYKQLRISKCEKDGTHFSYFSIPDHPEKGYKYLNRDLDFYIYRNLTEDYIKLSDLFTDIKRINPYIELSDYSFKLFKISVACHYMFGMYFLENFLNKKYSKYISKFLQRLDFYINYEFPGINEKEYRYILEDTFYLVFCISVGDILGSKYDKNAKDLEEYRIYNQLPNVENPVYDFRGSIGEKDISANELIKRSSVVFNDILLQMKKFKSCKLNNYAILKNMKDVNNILSIHTMFPQFFPKVVTFDLDETVFTGKILGNNISYNYFPETVDFIKHLKELKQYGVKLAIASRHYFPNSFIHEKEFIELFDIVICIYTGENDKTYEEFRKHFGSFVENQEDFIKVGEKIFLRNRQNQNSKFVDKDGEIFEIDLNFLRKTNKSLHIDIIKKVFSDLDVENKDIYLYDDDNNYIYKRGIYEDVKVIAAMKGFRPYDGFCLCLYESIVDECTKSQKNITQYIQEVKDLPEFLSLIRGFVNYQMKDLDSMIDSGADDKEIIEYMKSKTKPAKTDLAKKEKSATYKARDIHKIISQSLRNLKVNRYLDIGSSDGTTTVKVGQLLGLNQDQIFGIDFPEFASEPIVPVGGFQFVQYSPNDTTLPFPDNYFEVVTMLQVLHHVKNPLQMISEIKRVLKPNGILFLREHDSNNEKMDMLIRLQHLFYSQVVHNIDYDTYMKTKYEEYFSKSQLEKMMRDNNFQKIGDYSTGMRENPTNVYYIMFTNKK